MVHLLKQKSKAQSAQKSRKSYEALEFSKRRKTEENDLQNVSIRQPPANVVQQDGKGQKLFK